MQCPACSTENPAGATFCQHCGASLTAAPPPASGGYTQVPQPGAAAPSGYAQAPPAAGYAGAQSGLSDNAAGAIAYITIIPAIVFLVLEPYNRKPFVRFHSWQSICLNIGCIILSVAFSILAMIAGMLHLGILAVLLWPILWIAILVLWILCLASAAQGKMFKIPIIGDIAQKQAGR